MRRAHARLVHTNFVRSCCKTTMQCNAKRRFVLQRSHFTLHVAFLMFCTSHFTLHTSSHLISSHLISFLLKCHASSSQLLTSYPSTAQLSPSHYMETLLNSSQFFCAPELLLLDRSSSTQTLCVLYLGKKRFFNTEVSTNMSLCCETSLL